MKIVDAAPPKPKKPRYSIPLTHPSYSVEACPNCGYPEADGGYCPDCGQVFRSTVRDRRSKR